LLESLFGLFKKRDKNTKRGKASRGKQPHASSATGGGKARTTTLQAKPKLESPARPRVAPERIGELGEYKIDVQLRQFPKDCRYVSDVMFPNARSKSGYSQIDHILITPVGVFVIETKNYAGRIKGRRGDKYWRVNGKFNMYNPLRQNYGHIKVLSGVLTEFRDLKFISVVSFTKRCELYIDNELRDVKSDELVVADIKLTEMIERKMMRLKATAERPPLTETEVDRIVEIISTKNITDVEIRAEHVEKINESTRV
jgi:hypothetical protein